MYFQYHRKPEGILLRGKVLKNNIPVLLMQRFCKGVHLTATRDGLLTLFEVVSKMSGTSWRDVDTSNHT